MPYKLDFEGSAKDLKALIHQYFEQCDQDKKPYSEAGLCYYLGLPISRYKYLMDCAYRYTQETQNRSAVKCDINDESIQWAHVEVLAQEVLRIADQLSSRSDKMALAQVRNARLGGYEDRPAAKAGTAEPIKVEMTLKGLQRGVDPFA